MPTGPFLPAHTRVEGGRGQGGGPGRKLAENGRARTCERLNRPAYALRNGVRPCAPLPLNAPFCPGVVRCRGCASGPRSVRIAAAVRGRRRSAPRGRRRCPPRRPRRRRWRSGPGAPGRSRTRPSARRRSLGRVICPVATASRTPLGRAATTTPPTIMGHREGYVRGQAGALPSAPRSGMLRGTFEPPPGLARAPGARGGLWAAGEWSRTLGVSTWKDDSQSYRSSLN